MAADNAAQCVIQANRFIPWRKKTVANKTINIDRKSGNVATVDIGDAFTPPPGSTLPPTPDLTNNFDGPNGCSPSPEGLPPTSGISHIDLASWFTGVTITPPLDVPPAGTVRPKTLDWLLLLNEAGPPALDRSDITGKLRMVLQNAAAGDPVVPDDEDVGENDNPDD
jgi:hypothetical protein